MTKTVIIDCFPESVAKYDRSYAIVAIDIIRATTTAVTAAARGRSCYPVPSLEAAVPLAARLRNPLLVGELGGNMPYGFHVNNSPADMDTRADISRPMILLSTSGTRVLTSGYDLQPVYAACLRNFTAQARHLARHHAKVAIIGAGTRGQFREEDQLGCAWIAELLLEAGYAPEDEATAELVRRWSGAPVEAITQSQSAEYLRRSDQLKDLDFVLTHVDDLDVVYRYQRGMLMKQPTAQLVAARAS